MNKIEYPLTQNIEYLHICSIISYLANNYQFIKYSYLWLAYWHRLVYIIHQTIMQQVLEKPQQLMRNAFLTVGCDNYIPEYIYFIL